MVQRLFSSIFFYIFYSMTGIIYSDIIKDIPQKQRAQQQQRSAE